MNKIKILNKYQMWQKAYGGKIFYFIVCPLIASGLIFFSLWYNNFEEYIALNKLLFLFMIWFIFGVGLTELFKFILIRRQK